MLFSLIASTLVSAENDPYYIGISMGPAFEQLDETEASQHMVRSSALDFDNSFCFQLRAGYIKNSYLTGEASIEYLFPFEAESEREIVEFDVLHLAFQSKLTYQKTGPIHPYALIGLGLINSQMKVKLKWNNTSIKDSEWGLSAKLGAGVDIYITPNIFSHIELNLTKGLGNVDYIQYPAFVLGGNYRF